MTLIKLKKSLTGSKVACSVENVRNHKPKNKQFLDFTTNFLTHLLNMFVKKL